MSLPLKGVILSVALTLALPSGQLPADDYDDGMSALAKKEYAKAIPLLTKAIAQNQNNAKAFLFLARGVSYQGIGELDKALADYDETIRLDPKKSSAYFRRGTLLHGKGELDQALAAYDMAIRLDPNDVLAYINRGTAWINKNEFEKALADFDKAIRLDPKNSLSYEFRGAIWYAKGENGKALADFGEAVRLNPKSSAAYHGRGAARQVKGDLDKALADYDESIRLNPKYSEAYINRGAAWFAKGDYQKALADFDEAIRLAPKFSAALNHRAWVRATCPDAKFRDGAKAIEDATNACELTDWKMPGCLETLAAAYAEAGQFDNAVEWQKKAIGLAPEAEKDDFGTRLVLYQAKKAYREERE